MYYLYILTNKSNTLYIACTSNLARRLEQYKYKLVDSFTQKYNISKLIYVENYNTLEEALLRERQLKNWRRSKKIALIKIMNPEFKDLSLTLIV